jgi:hypothetical protein
MILSLTNPPPRLWLMWCSREHKCP